MLIKLLYPSPRRSPDHALGSCSLLQTFSSPPARFASPTDHNTLCMMPLEVSCASLLYATTETHEEEVAGVGSLPPFSGWKPVGHSLGAATSVRRNRNLQRGLSPCARTLPSSLLLGAGPLPRPLLPDAARERVAEHELSSRNVSRCRCDLLGALLRDLLVGDGLGELTDPKSTGISGGAVGRQDVVGSYGLVGVSHCRVFPEEERTVVGQAFEEPVGVFGLHL